MTILPFNASKLERALESAPTTDFAVSLTDLWNPWTCPEQALPWLAWALHITDAEGWSLAVTTDQKRALIARSVELHKKKGTPFSIREALKSIGFNEVEILERLPINRYDGTQTHAGAQRYDAYGWAEFRLLADVGDTQPITSAQTERIVQTVNEWKPARCHLVDVQYSASQTETVEVDDQSTLSAHLHADDALLWGRTYNGDLNYGQGVLNTYAGALQHSGEADYFSWRASAADIRHDAVRETDAMDIVLQMSDQQGRQAMHDGSYQYAGAIDQGATTQVAIDPPMPIVVTRQLRHNGRRSYAAHMFNGDARYGGGITHFGNVPYRGDAVTHLEA
ncbi:phage tail protein I [Castellaniella sp. S9]|uniref:phage tail protein I n=1 Tax=Castellaniella sp. S9 TaxID=2993652 RepID=UPI0022B5994E|nr:phage tail protein I [Castellaniella sp. S9]